MQVFLHGSDMQKNTVFAWLFSLLPHCLLWEEATLGIGKEIWELKRKALKVSNM